MKRNYFLLFFLISLISFSQKFEKDLLREYSAIGFWNVENLYDTLDDPFKNDDDFTPGGSYVWIGERYRAKIEHLSLVIQDIATDISSDGLALLGLCEIENKSVLKDLVNSPALLDRNYQIVHFDGPDARGVDPALIYNPKYFKVTRAKTYPIKLVTDSLHKTRDILVVSGLLKDEPMALLINHWPSRRGGELLSRPNRNAAAQLARKIVDSISERNPNAKIIIMGDLNDDPVNECVKKYIGTYSDSSNPKEGKYFNPMEELYKKGIGSIAYQDSWNLFDQILLNNNWLLNANKEWQYASVRVNNKAQLRTLSGNYKGYPFRTYSGGIYTGGYSDHFATYIIISKKKN